MNRFTTLVETAAASLQVFDHPPGEPHSDPETESSGADTVSFVEQGSFEVRARGRRLVLRPGSIFITSPGMTFSCRHEQEVPVDRCLSIAYAEPTVEDLRRADLPPLRPPVTRVSARQTYLQHRLRSCGERDGLRFELLAGALFASFAAQESARSERRPSAEQRRGVDRAIDLMEAEFGRSLTLYELARASAMSPFHFARTFRAMVGVPPHRFLTAVRLRQAEQLLAGGMGVTDACFEVGFGSLSHFIRLYKRRFGVVPSAARRGAPARSPLAAALWGAAG